MRGEATPDGILARLEQVLASGVLPSKAAKSATALLHRLKAPVRLVLMGPPGGGKTTLMNVFCGQAIVPEEVGLPTTVLRYGDEARMRVTLADGSRRDLPGAMVADAAALDPSMVEVWAPLPFLKRISMMELVTDGSAEEMAAAARWAAKRADMVIWVTPEFGAVERRIWNQMPDALKTHAFLVMSQLDRHSYERQDLIRQMPQTATGGEFLGMFPVSALQVAVVQEAGVEDLQPVKQAAGVSVLVEALLRRLDLGRQSDLDAAEFFALRYGDGQAAGAAQPPAVRVPSRPASVQVAAPHAPAAPADWPRSVQPQSVQPRSDPVRRPGIEPAPATPEQAAPSLRMSDMLRDPGETPGPQAAPPDEDRPRSGRLYDAAAPAPAAASPSSDGLNEALAALRGQAATMLAGLADASDPLIEVLGHCADTMETLADLALGEDELETAVDQAADVVLLLQMERSEGAAEDAVCVLLQLKREFETRLAA